MKRGKSIRIIALIIAIVLSFSGLDTSALAQTAKNSEGTISGAYEYGESGQPYVEQFSDDTYTNTSVKLSWYSYGSNTGFYMYRKSKYDTAYKKMADIKNDPYSRLTYTDKSFIRGLTFTYQLVPYSVNTDGSVYVFSESTLTLKCNYTIDTGHIKSISRSKTTAKIKWSKQSGIDGYELYKKTSGGKYKLLKRIKGASKYQYTVKKVSKTKAAYVKIRAYKKYNGKYVYGKFSASEKIITLSQSIIVKKIKKLKKQFPSGKYWNHRGKKKWTYMTITSKPCHHYGTSVCNTCNYYDCPNNIRGYQCYGFAWLMSDLVYGRKAKIKNFKSFSKCKMGDVIRYRGHSVFITEKHSNYIVVGECNIGNTCIIKWGRRIYKSELSGAVYSRRY